MKKNRTPYTEKQNILTVYDSSGTPKKYTEKELGVSGLALILGKIREDTIKQLQGVNKIKVYEEMVNYDPQVGAFNNMYQSMASSVQWRIEPCTLKSDADEKTKKKAQDQADFISSVLFEDLDHPFQDSVKNGLTAPQYGFALQEPVYKIRDGKNSKFDDGLIGLSKLAPRYQGSIYRWLPDEYGSSNIVTVQQRHPVTFQYINIPYDKLLHFTHRSLNNNPQGTSIYSNCACPYLNKKYATDLELIRLERGFDGLLTITGPAPVFDEKTKNPSYLALQQWIKDTIQNVRNGTNVGIACPNFLKIEILNPGQGNMPDADKIIERETRNIATALLADFFLVQQKSGNSAGFTSSKIKIFTKLITEMLDEYTRVMNGKLITGLIKRNMMDVNLCPKLTHTEIADLDLTNMMLFFQAFQKGFIPESAGLANTFLRNMFGNDAPQYTQDEIDDMVLRRDTQTVSNDNGTLAQEAAETSGSKKVKQNQNITTDNNKNKNEG